MHTKMKHHNDQKPELSDSLFSRSTPSAKNCCSLPGRIRSLRQADSCSMAVQTYFQTNLHATFSSELILCLHPFMLKLLPLASKHLLLLLLCRHLALGCCQALLLHMLLDRHTDGACQAQTLLMMLQQLPRCHTPAASACIL